MAVLSLCQPATPWTPVMEFSFLISSLSHTHTHTHKYKHTRIDNIALWYVEDEFIHSLGLNHIYIYERL